MVGLLEDCVGTYVLGVPALGDIYVGAAIPGSRTPTDAALIDGAVYSCRAQSGTDTIVWETGDYTWRTDGAYWERTSIAESSSGGSKVSLGADAIVMIVARKEHYSGLSLLTEDTTYYVRSDGDDTNDGLTDSAGGAFRRIKRATDQMSRINAGGFNVKIRIGDGTWLVAEFDDDAIGGTGNDVVMLVKYRPFNARTFQIIGNQSNPSACVFQVYGPTPDYDRLGWERTGIVVSGCFVENIVGFRIVADDYENGYEATAIRVVNTARVNQFYGIEASNIDYVFKQEFDTNVAWASISVDTYFGNLANVRNNSRGTFTFYFIAGTIFNSYMDGVAFKADVYSRIKASLFYTNNITVEDAWTQKYRLEVFSYLEALNIPGTTAGQKDASCYFNL
jgi:hypothetical protein